MCSVDWSEPADFLYLQNIPSQFHASDLRKYFSQYVECSAFVCFHFRHRKQWQKSVVSLDSNVVKLSRLTTLLCDRQRDGDRLCALIAIRSVFRKLFLREYFGEPWLPDDDFCENKSESNSGICQVYLIVNDTLPCAHNGTPCPQNISSSLKSLIEFNPPEFMPQGNVGTPTLYFFRLINLCLLDSTLITKLGLEFNKLKVKRKYGAVPFTYDTDTLDSMPPENKYALHLRSTAFKQHQHCCQTEILRTKSEVDLDHSDTESLIVDGICDDDFAEEWERFESLHDDPYHLTRSNKANIKYEEKAEQPWEKGGPGLVWHTDERIWRKLDPLRKEDPFDEPANRDWDIDMEVYEEQQGGVRRAIDQRGYDMDTKQLIEMKQHKTAAETSVISANRSSPQCQLLASRELAETFDDLEATGIDYSRVLLNGYGGRLLRRFGWRPGTPLTGAADADRPQGRRQNIRLLEPLGVQAVGCLSATVVGNWPGLGYHGLKRTWRRLGDFAPTSCRHGGGSNDKCVNAAAVSAPKRLIEAKMADGVVLRQSRVPASSTCPAPGLNSCTDFGCSERYFGGVAPTFCSGHSKGNYIDFVTAVHTPALFSAIDATKARDAVTRRTRSLAPPAYLVPSECSGVVGVAQPAGPENPVAGDGSSGSGSPEACFMQSTGGRNAKHAGLLGSQSAELNLDGDAVNARAMVRGSCDCAAQLALQLNDGIGNVKPAFVEARKRYDADRNTSLGRLVSVCGEAANVDGQGSCNAVCIGLHTAQPTGSNTVNDLTTLHRSRSQLIVAADFPVVCGQPVELMANSDSGSGVRMSPQRRLADVVFRGNTPGKTRRTVILSAGAKVARKGVTFVQGETLLPNRMEPV